MSQPRNFRQYFLLLVLLVSGIIILLHEHRPSFLRPNLHMYAYVSTSDGSLTIVDLAALRSISKIPVASNITALLEHPTRGEIWGISNSTGAVFVLDTPTNQITRIPAGNSPFSLDFSHDASRLYTTVNSPDQLVAIDTASRTILGRAHTDPDPIYARITPDAKNILVVHRRPSTLTIHDARTLQLLVSLPVIPQPDDLAIVPDSSLAFVISHSHNHLSVIDINRAVLLTNLQLAGTPTQMLLKPDGGELYVISPQAHGLQAIDTWTHEVADTMLLGSAPTTAILTTDASELYVADPPASRVIPVDILNRRLLAHPIPTGASPSAMRFSPADPGANSPMLLVVDQSSDDLAVIRSRTDSLLTLIPVGPHPQLLAVKTF